jgi:hypothetical protein
MVTAAGRDNDDGDGDMFDNGHRDRGDHAGNSLNDGDHQGDGLIAVLNDDTFTTRKNHKS